MSNTAAKSDKQIIEEAAAFHARVAAHDMTAAEWSELETWINQDPAHRKVFQSMEQISGSLKLLRGAAGRKVLGEITPTLVPVLEECDDVASSASNRRRTWRVPPRHLAIAASLLVALVIPVLYFLGSPDVPEPLLFEATIGERKTVELADGSSLTLNADSRISVTFTDRERRVSLRRGEVYLDVAAEPDRSFHVVVGTHEVTVVGTAFNIRHRDGPARVTVHEGRVLVTQSAEDASLAQSVELRAGQRLVLAPGAVPTELSQDELANGAGWRDGWLHFSDHSLEAVARELNLYVDKRIVIGSNRAANLRVGGSFNVDRFDSLLTALESVLPIEIRRTEDSIIIDYAADATL